MRLWRWLKRTFWHEVIDASKLATHQQLTDITVAYPVLTEGTAALHELRKRDVDSDIEAAATYQRIADRDPVMGAVRELYEKDGFATREEHRQEIVRRTMVGERLRAFERKDLEFDFAEDRLISVVVHAKTYVLPQWAFALGWADAYNAWRWADVWQWPGRPWFDGKTYHAPAPDHPDDYDIGAAASSRPAPEIDSQLRDPYVPTNLGTPIKVGDIPLSEPISERALLDADEHALFEQLAPDTTEKLVAYPPAITQEEVRAWVAVRLASDVEVSQGSSWTRLGKMAYTVQRGFSMSYLRSLVDRVNRLDETLSDEELIILRSRNLI